MTTKLGIGIETGGYHGNIHLDTLARITRNIQQTLAVHPNIGRDATTDAHLLTHGEHWFVTPMGEVIFTHAISAFDGGDGIVGVYNVERDCINASGLPVPYAYETDVLSLIDRMEADGGWTEISAFERVGTANCPRCGAFMSIGKDDDGFPFSRCVCGCDVGPDYLLDEEAVVGVF